MAEKNVSINPTPENVPKMDRPSIAFARFMDSMVIEWNDDRTRLVLACNLCMDGLCNVEDGDSLRILLNTALAHDCM